MAGILQQPAQPDQARMFDQLNSILPANMPLPERLQLLTSLQLRRKEPGMQERFLKKLSTKQENTQEFRKAAKKKIKLQKR